MPIQDPHSQQIAFPLDALLSLWESEVRVIDPATHLLIQQTVQQFGMTLFRKNDFAGIRRLIGPILAQNEEEQALFQEIFDLHYLPYLKERFEVESVSVDTEGEEKPLSEQLKGLSKKWRPILYVGLVVLLFGLNFLFMRDQVDAPYIPEKKLTEEVIPLDSLPPLVTKWDSAPPMPPKIVIDKFLDSTNSIKVYPRQQSASIAVNQLLTFYPRLTPVWFQPRSRYFIQPLWDFGDGHTADSLVATHTYTHPGIYPVKFTHYYPESDRISFHQELVFVPSVNPNTQDYHGGFFTDILTEVQTQIKLRIFILLFLIVFIAEGGLKLIKRRFSNLAFKMEFQQKGDGSYELPLPQPSGYLKDEEALQDLAKQLKKRRMAGTHQLDIQDTIHQTIRSGGLPQLVYAQQSKEAEYVFLIDESHASDHRAQVFQELVSFLEKEGVALERFTFRGDPHTCYNAFHPDGIEFRKITINHPHSRLVIFSEGTAFVDSISLELKPWVAELFDLWGEKMLFTPLERHAWTRREASLASYFQLLPADIKTQLTLFEEFEQPSLWEETEAAISAETALAEYDFEDALDVEAFLGEDLTQWLAATMVHPHPRWEIVLAVGRAIEAEMQAGKTDFESEGHFTVAASTGQLVNLANLSKLAQIPWMDEKNYPENVRRTLLDMMDEELEVLARQTVISLLDQTVVEKDSAAYGEKRLHTTVQEAALHPDDQLLQKKLRYLWLHDRLDSYQTDKFNQDRSLRDTLAKWSRLMPLRAAVVALLMVGAGSFSIQKWNETLPQATVSRHIEPLPVGVADENLGLLRESLSAYALQDYERTVREVEKLAEITSEENGHQILGKIYQINGLLHLGDYEQAKSIIEECLKEEKAKYLHQDLAELLQWYNALALVGEGQPEEGKQALESIMALEGNHYLHQRAFLLLWDMRRPWYKNRIVPSAYMEG